MTDLQEVSRWVRDGDTLPAHERPEKNLWGYGLNKYDRPVPVSIRVNGYVYTPEPCRVAITYRSVGLPSMAA